MNKAQRDLIFKTGDELFSAKTYTNEDFRQSVWEFAVKFVEIDPTPDPPKYKIIKNNDYVLDDDLTQEEAERYLHSLMKNCLRDFYDLEYYNRGDSLTISKKNEFIHYNLEQE